MKQYGSSLKGYIKDLAKKTTACGGGSAASLVFCVGASLIEMAIAFSLNKHNSKELKGFLKLLRKEKEKVFLYIDLDGDIFSRAMKEKGVLRKKIARDLERITFNLGKSCVKVLTELKKIKPFIKKSILSDFDIGLKCIRVSLFASIKNMEANQKFFSLRSGKKINYLKRFLG